MKLIIVGIILLILVAISLCFWAVWKFIKALAKIDTEEDDDEEMEEPAIYLT